MMYSTNLFRLWQKIAIGDPTKYLRSPKASHEQCFFRFGVVVLVVVSVVAVVVGIPLAMLVVMVMPMASTADTVS